MTDGRRKFISRLALAIVLAHVAAMVFEIDQWPLSNYPMFSGLMKNEVRRQMAFGVTPDGSEVLLLNDAYFSPLGANKLSQCLSTAQRADEKQKKRSKIDIQPRLPGVASSLLAVYSAHRAAGAHHGPPIEGLRLYEVTWRIDPTLANLEQPQHRKLLAEYVASKP